MESLIELRQQNKQTNVTSNGDFECQIVPLTLMRNDTIAIKQAFIDNIAKESGKIIIPKDVSSITFKYCMYLQDQDTTVEKAFASRDYFPDTILEADSPTGKNYVLSSKDPGGGGQPVVISAVSAATDCLITTATAHNFVVGNKVVIKGISSSTSTAINGTHVVETVVDSDKFQVGFNSITNDLTLGADPQVVLDSVDMCHFSQITLENVTEFRTRSSVLRGRFTYKDSGGSERDWNFEIKKDTWEKMVKNSYVQPNPDGRTRYTWDRNGFTGSTLGNLDITWSSAPPFGFQCQRNAYGTNVPLKFTSVGEDDAKKGKFGFSGIPTSSITDISSGNCFNPWQFTSTVQLPAGAALTPIELTRILTRGLTDAQPNDAAIPAGQLVTPQMLDSQDNMIARGQTFNGSEKAKSPYWVCADGSHILQIKDNNKNYIFGSSNFDFGFDIDTNLASIDSMHSSIYTGAGLQCIVPMDINNRKFVLNKTGGIFITSCDQPDLLTKGLNLPPTIFTQPGPIETKAMGALGNVTMTTFDLRDGVNVTGQSRFCDAYITKSPGGTDASGLGFDRAPAGSPSSVDYAKNFGVASDQITSIHGTAPIGNDPDNLGGQDATPYYQIELTSNFGFNKISNGRSSKKISAIVNTYYSTENFTTADASMGTMYVHDSDEPLQISSIRVRILKPDGSLVGEDVLQDDNTVFLSVIQQSTNDRIQQALQDSSKNKK